MTLGPPVSPVPSLRYRWLLVPLIVGAVVGTAMFVAARPAAALKVMPEPYVCVMPEAPHEPPPPEPKAQPGTAAWDLLARCLATHRFSPPSRPPSLEEIRGFVRNGDPVWLYENAWNFPLSDEGDAQMPSGWYVVVPLDGSPCGESIVN
jgi:hypothetical protein